MDSLLIIKGARYEKTTDIIYCNTITNNIKWM